VGFWRESPHAHCESLCAARLTLPWSGPLLGAPESEDSGVPYPRTYAGVDQPAEVRQAEPQGVRLTPSKLASFA